ncbi:unnamed protein product [Caenorhabditis brenneri]
MENTPLIPDLPIEIYPHILHNLDIWNFVQSRSVCKEFKRIVDHHLSIQKSWKFSCESDGRTEVSMDFPDSFHRCVYSKTDSGCEALYSIENRTRRETIKRVDVVKIKRKFEGKDPNEIGIENFGLVARNPLVRLDDCFLCLDAEREEIFFKEVFGRMDHKLQTKYLEFYGTPLSIIRRVLCHVEPGFLQQLWICDSPMGEEAEEVAKEIAKMDHWKLAKELMVDGWDDLSSFPIDDVLHTRKFIIDLVEITVEDLVRVKEKLFSSPIFEEGMIRHYEGLTIDDFTEGLGQPATRRRSSNIAKFLRPARLVNWEVVFDKNAQLDSAIASLVNTMKEIGMQVENPQRSFIVNGNLKPIFTEAVKNKRQMLLFITPDQNNYHQEMKVLELEHDMLTQDIKFTTAERYVRQPNTRKNIANKINIKLGGLNYDVESKYFDKNRLVIGFETSQKGGGGDAPIAIGFSANMSDHHMKFTGGYYLVKRSSDVYGPIIEKVVSLCINQTKKNRTAPTSIVVYFSGVTEGQYGPINEKYVGELKAVCRSIEGNYRPHITVIAATKLHNTRLYKQDQRGVSNMEPGTIIDETIVNPLLGEWYNSSC